MNMIFTLNSKTYLNQLKFQTHQFGISHDLCLHFVGLELLCPYILPINTLHRELFVSVYRHPNYC